MYTIEKAREEIIKAGLRLVEDKLIARTWGNISARISDNEFIITPSGRDYTTLTPDDLVTVKIDDLSYEGDIKPSSEKAVHAVIYANRPDADFIVHTHQFYASVLAAECCSTWVAPCAAYAMPGTSKLARNAEYVLSDYPETKVMLLARHGAVVMAGDSEEAFELAHKLEEDSKKMVESRVTVEEAAPCSEEEMQAALDAAGTFATIANDPYVMQCCSRGGLLRPYIDDFAQIAGAEVLCVDNKPTMIRGALKGKNAVLVRGVGAVCTGPTQEDADAAAMIVSKNAAAACYVKRARPLSPVDARLQRNVYINDYSGNKEERKGDEHFGEKVLFRDLSGKPVVGRAYNHIGEKLIDIKEGIGEKIVFRDLSNGSVERGYNHIGEKLIEIKEGIGEKIVFRDMSDGSAERGYNHIGEKLIEIKEGIGERIMFRNLSDFDDEENEKADLESAEAETESAASEAE